MKDGSALSRRNIILRVTSSEIEIADTVSILGGIDTRSATLFGTVNSQQIDSQQDLALYKKYFNVLFEWQTGMIHILKPRYYWQSLTALST